MHPGEWKQRCTFFNKSLGDEHHLQGAQAKMALTKLGINSNFYFQTTQFIMIFF
jgi:hypothetical protein